jgi:predicted RNase H-like HicB family nuclease
MFDFAPSGAIPEIVTYGRTEQEALGMAEDAIRLVLEDCAPTSAVGEVW